MKFEYDDKSDDRECVAFIDDDGDLCVKDINTDMGVYVGITDASTEKFIDYMSLNGNGSIHKFYPGDKITITF